MADGADVAHAAMRGAIGAMAMTGMRMFAKDAGVMRQTPPEAIARQRRAGGVMRYVPRRKRRAAVEVMHWTVGVVGGLTFGALPEAPKNHVWFGPLYGVGLLLSFDFGIAPLLGLKPAKSPKPLEQAALVTDHLMYGFVLSEMRRRPRD